MHICWTEQREADLPRAGDWLSDGEALRLEGMRFPKRRADWRLGRWTAKQALAAWWTLPDNTATFRRIEILAAPSGAPEVYLDGRPGAVTISLSHRGGVAACAVGPAGIDLGCDVETIEPRSNAFAADYFTLEEQALISESGSRDLLLALLWSAKESTLKALRTGLRLDTRSVTVQPSGVGSPAPDWRPLQARCADGPVFHGWWHCDEKIVRTMLSAPPAVTAPSTTSACSRQCCSSR